MYPMRTLKQTNIMVNAHHISLLPGDVVLYFKAVILSSGTEQK